MLALFPLSMNQEVEELAQYLAAEEILVGKVMAHTN